MKFYLLLSMCLLCSFNMFSSSKEKEEEEEALVLYNKQPKVIMLLKEPTFCFSNFSNGYFIGIGVPYFFLEPGSSRGNHEYDPIYDACIFKTPQFVITWNQK
jgi:hypothetical protein